MTVCEHRRLGKQGLNDEPHYQVDVGGMLARHLSSSDNPDPVCHSIGASVVCSAAVGVLHTLCFMILLLYRFVVIVPGPCRSCYCLYNIIDCGFIQTHVLPLLVHLVS